MGIWNAVSLVTGAFSMVAFIVATAYWTYRRKLLNTERLIASVPDGERSRVLTDFLEAVHVDTTDLTKNQRYELAREIIAARSRHSVQRASLVALFGLLAAGVALTALSQADGRRAKEDSIPAEVGAALTEEPAPTVDAPANPPLGPPIHIAPQEQSGFTPLEEARTRANNNSASVQEPDNHAALTVTNEALSQPFVKLILHGQLLDELTRAPVEGASIRILGMGAEAATDVSGRYSLEIGDSTPGLALEGATIKVAADGYLPLTSAITLRPPVTEWSASLRSIAAERFLGLGGRWEALEELDEEAEIFVELELRRSTLSRLDGSLSVTLTVDPEQADGDWLPLQRSDFCRIRCQAAAYYTDAGVRIRLIDHQVESSSSMINCSRDMVSEAGWLYIRSSDLVEIGFGPADPLVGLRRVAFGDD